MKFFIPSFSLYATLNYREKTRTLQNSENLYMLQELIRLRSQTKVSPGIPNCIKRIL